MIDVEHLLGLRWHLDKLTAKKAPEVEVRIAALEDALKTIKETVRK